MPTRLAPAFVLGITLLTGCVSVNNQTGFFLISNQSTMRGWPWKRSTASQPASRPQTNSPRTSAAEKATSLAHLPEDLQQEIEQALEGKSDQDRTRLKAYLATVSPSQIPAMLAAMNASRQTAEQEQALLAESAPSENREPQTDNPLTENSVREDSPAEDSITDEWEEAPADLEAPQRALRPNPPTTITPADRSASDINEPKITTAQAFGRPRLELASDELTEGPQVQQVVATIEAVPTEPVIQPREPRPTRHPLVELDATRIEFEGPSESVSDPLLAQPSAQPIEPEKPVPAPHPLADTAPESQTASGNPLTRLKEWTSLRKTEPTMAASQGQTGNGQAGHVAAAQPPANMAHSTATSGSPIPGMDASSQALQSLGRKLRGTPTPVPTQTVQLPATPPEQVDVNTAYLKENIQRLISLMEAEAARLKPGSSFAERDEYVRLHAELRMLYLMARNPVRAQQAIPGTDPETREFWTALMWALSNYFDENNLSDPSERAAATLTLLREAEQHLQGLAGLELRSLALCERIEGFGVFHPFEQTIFRPGQQILLYAEIRNFKSELVNSGHYRTLLRSTVEIVRQADEPELIERKVLEATEDLSRSPRTDYFHSYKLDLPGHLIPGTYQIRLTLEDELTGRLGSSSLEFQVR